MSCGFHRVQHATRVRIAPPAASRGFTLVEFMILVSFLGVLTAVVIPRVADRAADARVAVLDARLSELRQAIALYYHQHHGVYPGALSAADGKSASPTPEVDFVQQLVEFTDENGVTSPTRDDTHRFGPYLRQAALPLNPFTRDNALSVDIATTRLSADLHTPGSPTSWRFALQVGKLIANDSAENAQH